MKASATTILSILLAALIVWLDSLTGPFRSGGMGLALLLAIGLYPIVWMGVTALLSPPQRGRSGSAGAR